MNFFKVTLLINMLFITQALAQAPDTLWTRRVDNNGNNDVCLDVAVDSANNIVIIGQSYDNVPYGYIFIMKYNPSGDTIWTRRYPANSGLMGNYAGGVTIDKEGNIIVTSVFEDDCLTIKYNANGDTIWSRRYDSGDEDCAYDVAVDQYDNIIITGGSYNNEGNWDYLTVKYKPNGDTVWTRRYDSGDSDWAEGVVIDDSNNIIVAGVGESIEYGVIKYSPTGDSLWGAEFFGEEAHDVAVDTANNIIVTGAVYNLANDYLTIQYNHHGDILGWMVYDAGGWDIAWAVTVDNHNSIIVTGSTYSAGESDFCTVKYSQDGDTVWTAKYDRDYDQALGVCLDSTGSIIVVGTVWSVHPDSFEGDYLIVKYKPEVGIDENSQTPLFLNGFHIRNYPNPFTNQTYISYALANDMNIEVAVYNSLGQKVATLENEYKKAGLYNVSWDRRTDSGIIVPSGIYFCRIEAEGIGATEKMVILD